MRHYDVHKRGDKYRVGAPGWFFWHWFRENNGFTSWVYETDDYADAKRTKEVLNKASLQRHNFRRDFWKVVLDGKAK